MDVRSIGIWMLCGFGAAGCNHLEEDKVICSSGQSKDNNASEGAEMLPGHPCNSCHADENAASGEGDAPIFTFAGTVYPTRHEPDNCIGSAAEGALVEVFDANGTMYVATVNKVGNFTFEDAKFVYPYKARVTFQGRQRTMVAAQTDGDCNTCHTVDGAEDAPGRIRLP